jgi:hypothetical protein
MTDVYFCSTGLAEQIKPSFELGRSWPAGTHQTLRPVIMCEYAHAMGNSTGMHVFAYIYASMCEYAHGAKYQRYVCVEVVRIYVNICIYIYIYMHTHTYITHTRTHAHTYSNIHTYIHTKF